jgi:hypothetical protein
MPGGALLLAFPQIAYPLLPTMLIVWMFPLLQVSPLLGLFGLFGPALAAIVMAAVMGGRPGVKALLARVVRWRVGTRWYVVALCHRACLRAESVATAAGQAGLVKP